MTVRNFTFDQHRLSSAFLLFAHTTVNRDTKLIAILRRQHCIILRAGENMLSVYGPVASRLRPIRPFVTTQIVIIILSLFSPPLRLGQHSFFLAVFDCFFFPLSLFFFLET